MDEMMAQWECKQCNTIHVGMYPYKIMHTMLCDYFLCSLKCSMKNKKEWRKLL